MCPVSVLEELNCGSFRAVLCSGRQGGHSAAFLRIRHETRLVKTYKTGKLSSLANPCLSSVQLSVIYTRGINIVKEVREENI